MKGLFTGLRTTAKVLALVATLAALAALGRMAFAPLPNVKPTTDIVLLTGYVSIVVIYKLMKADNS